MMMRNMNAQFLHRSRSQRIGDGFVGFCDFCLKATLSAVGGGVLAYVTADSKGDPKAEKTKTQRFVGEILKIRGSKTFP
ncbi:hypothetical protein ISN45_Aa07g039300 [Arabidopsis thaliana x Arabidopsis arenosa]|uniref:Uncharacterized protein n=1 Tax=Arabidopsis thaliana x Arabidopsis arenosa TaxID=1240361 RepID=A0A8T1YDT1_9BRAS|nr:hypothetical protein ISN45_Aa07g039300 [Arabidopsis thaliana x Arabidopsis arenosa]